MTDRNRGTLTTKEFEELFSLGYHGRSPPVISPVEVVDSSDGWTQSMQDAGEMPTLRYIETVSMGAMAGFAANQVTYYITLKSRFLTPIPTFFASDRIIDGSRVQLIEWSLPPLLPRSPFDIFFFFSDRIID